MAVETGFRHQHADFLFRGRSHLSANRFRVETSPQIPARYAAVWLPTLGDFFHLVGSWKCDFYLWRFGYRLLGFRVADAVLLFCGAIEIMLMHCHAYAEITGAQHVCALQGKHQK